MLQSMGLHESNMTEGTELKSYCFNRNDKNLEPKEPK